MSLTPDEVAVFGDSDNDLPMIDAVPNSVAVANANEAVTAAARWHIGAAVDDAVAGVLHQIAACAATGGDAAVYAPAGYCRRESH